MKCRLHINDIDDCASTKAKVQLSECVGNSCRENFFGFDFDSCTLLKALLENILLRSY